MRLGVGVAGIGDGPDEVVFPPIMRGGKYKGAGGNRAILDGVDAQGWVGVSGELYRRSEVRQTNLGSCMWQDSECKVRR